MEVLNILSNLEYLTLKVKSNQGKVDRVKKGVLGDVDQWQSSYSNVQDLKFDLYHNKTTLSEGWRNGSAVRSMFCSSRGPEFDSSQLPVTLVPGQSLWELHSCAHTYT